MLNGEPVVLEWFGTLLPEKDIQDLGLTMSEIESQGRGGWNVNGKKMRYSCAKIDGEWIGQNNVYLIQVLPVEGIVSHILLLSMMISLLMAVFFVTIITYALSEEEYVVNHVLSEDEAKRYNPKRIRRKLRGASVFSAIVILAIAFLTQSVIQMRQQTTNGNITLELMSGQRNTDLEELSKDVREIRENWYLQYGNKIASFLKGRPEAQSEEKIRTCCKIIGADFIMLFDHDGNELLCSSDYDGFTITRGLGEDSSDFKRLLLGVPGIIHPVSVDKTTGLERQMIGVTVDLAGDGKEHGALILALMKDAADLGQESKVYEESFLMLPAETVCFEAEKTSGKIRYSSETSLEGKTVTEAGLSEKSLQDGYIDFCRDQRGLP